MIVSQQKIHEAVSVINLVPTRSGIPCSEFMRLRKHGSQLKLALASEVFGEVAIPGEHGTEDWTFYLDRKLFVPFVLASADLRSKAPFTFTIDKNKSLRISNGRRTARFSPIEELEGYSSVKSTSGADLILTKKQRQILYLASRYATRDPTAANLNCVYLLKGKAVISSTKYAIFYAEDKQAPVSLPLPLQIMDLLNSPVASKITTSKSYVVVVTAIGSVAQSLNEKAKDFPKDAAIKLIREVEKYPFQFALSAVPFVEVASRLNQYVSGTVNRDIVIDISGAAGDKFLRVVCQAPQGTFKERFAIKSKLQSTFTCSWLMDSILPLTDSAADLGDIKVYFNVDKKTPYCLRAKNIRLLLTTRK